MRFGNVLRNMYFGMRMIDMMQRRSGYRQRGNGLVQTPKPLTDKQIEQNYRKSRHVRVKHKRERVDGTALTIVFLLILLICLIINFPMH